MIYRIIHVFVFFITLLIVQISNAASIGNVLNAFFYSQNDSSYIILHESIFHPTSGLYEKGNLRAQGYNSSRISVYNLASGNCIAQKDMGVMDSAEYCILLGCSQDNLWLFSEKHKSGLQSLNPITLKSNASQAKIYNLLQVSIGRFYDGPWHTIKEFYGYDPVKNKLIISNTNKELYYIDVLLFTVEKIEKKIDLNILRNHYFTDEIVIEDSTWQLSGYANMYLECGDILLNKPSFLYGSFILQQNSYKLYKYFLSIKEKALQKDIVNDAAQNIQALSSGKKTDNVLLQSDPNSIFIFAKSEDKPESFIEVSKLISNKFGEFSTRWRISIPGIFFNVSKARGTKVFKRYFGDITPDFEYKLFDVYDNKLIIIYLSYMCCVDVESGDIIWRFKM